MLCNLLVAINSIQFNVNRPTVNCASSSCCSHYCLLYVYNYPLYSVLYTLNCMLRYRPTKTVLVTDLSGNA